MITHVPYRICETAGAPGAPTNAAGLREPGAQAFRTIQTFD